MCGSARSSTTSRSSAGCMRNLSGNLLSHVVIHLAIAGACDRLHLMLCYAHLASRTCRNINGLCVLTFFQMVYAISRVRHHSMHPSQSASRHCTMPCAVIVWMMCRGPSPNLNATVDLKPNPSPNSDPDPETYPSNPSPKLCRCSGWTGRRIGRSGTQGRRSPRRC